MPGFRNEEVKQPDKKEEAATIMPTMIDNDEISDTQAKRDLSAIIPQGVTNANGEGITLSSKEKELKSDGVSVIGIIRNEDNYETVQGAFLPETIDIAKRKEEFTKKKNQKKNRNNKVVKKKTNTVSKAQNITSLLSIVCIVGLIGFYFYYKSQPKHNDFTTLPVKIELGEKLPNRASFYVKASFGKKVDDLQYSLNTSKVVIDEVGNYEYQVTYKNVTKSGIISIVDTTPPELEVRDIVLTEGNGYKSESFVSECRDYNGCNFAFENEENATYKNPGKYAIFIAATDAYNNKTVKQALLVIEARGLVKKYTKQYPYDSDKGYSRHETYDLHFTDFFDDAVILNATHTIVYTYQDDEKYRADREKYNGEEHYSCDDGSKKITLEEPVYTVGYNYSDMKNVTNYLNSQGFTVDEGD